MARLSGRPIGVGVFRRRHEQPTRRRAARSDGRSRLRSERSRGGEGHPHRTRGEGARFLTALIPAVLRAATPADVADLRRIERDADQRFVAVGHPELADESALLPVDTAQRLITTRRITVAEVDRHVVGWVYVGHVDGEACIGQISVERASGGVASAPCCCSTSLPRRASAESGPSFSIRSATCPGTARGTSVIDSRSCRAARGAPRSKLTLVGVEFGFAIAPQANGRC